jgi:hypothetical protein
MALIFVLVGIIGTVVAPMGYAFSDIRDVEKKAPDHDFMKVEPSETVCSSALP